MNDGRMWAAATLATLLTTSSWAISPGPGGRMYFAGCNDQTGTNAVLIKSVVVTPNWTVGTFESHGTVANHRNDWNGGWESNPGRHSPEIMTSGGGKNGYAKLGMGLWYNNSPTSNVGKETMDILRINTSAGARTIDILGDGRANQTIVHKGSTDYGYLAIPDTANYSGQTNAFITEGLDLYAWATEWYINREGRSDSDMTDDDTDYQRPLVQEWCRPVPQDIELVGDRAYIYVRTFGQIEFVTKAGGHPWAGSAPSDDHGVFFTQTNATYSTFFYGGTPIAAGKVTVDGNLRDAVWFFAGTGTWTSATAWGQLRVAVDRNGNGTAMDPGEDVLLANVADVTGFGPFDLELIKGNDGKLFLVGMDKLGRVATTTLDANHNLIGVLELGPEGTNIVAKTSIDVGGNLANGTYQLDSLELDATPPVNATGSVVFLR